MPKEQQKPKDISQEPETSEQQLTSSAQAQVPTFPIRFLDAVLYDLRITRFPDQADKFMSPGGNLQIEISKPLLVGQRMELAIGLRIQVPNPDEPAFIIEVKLNGIFEITEGTDEQLINDFVVTSAPFLIWPYARELIQNLTVRMRVLPLMLPTLDLRSQPQGPLQQEARAE